MPGKRFIIDSGARMSKVTFRRVLSWLSVIRLVAGVAYLANDGASWAQQRKFEKKGCLDCHKKFAEKYLSMKDVHPVVKAGKCEDCHLRHGLVPKLMMKKDGNELCYSCHAKEKIGLNRAGVHTALKSGKCTSCHNPHASQGSHLLNAEGNGICYLCHKKENYEKKVVHKISQTQGCIACHFSHSGDEKNLLKKAETPLCLSCHESGKD